MLPAHTPDTVLHTPPHDMSKCDAVLLPQTAWRELPGLQQEAPTLVTCLVSIAFQDAGPPWPKQSMFTSSAFCGHAHTQHRHLTNTHAPHRHTQTRTRQMHPFPFLPPPCMQAGHPNHTNIRLSTSICTRPKARVHAHAHMYTRRSPGAHARMHPCTRPKAHMHTNTAQSTGLHTHAVVSPGVLLT